MLLNPYRRRLIKESPYGHNFKMKPKFFLCQKKLYNSKERSNCETKEMSNLMISNFLGYYTLMHSHTYFSVSCLSGWCCITLANASYSERNLNVISLSNSENADSRIKTFTP